MAGVVFTGQALNAVPEGAVAAAATPDAARRSRDHRPSSGTDIMPINRCEESIV